MAARAEHILRERPAAARRIEAEALAGLPAGVIAAVFERRAEATVAALQLTLDHGEERVWLATGKAGAKQMRRARSRRGLAHRLVAGLGDEASIVLDLAQELDHGASLVVVKAGPQGRTLSRLDAAAAVVHFGRWTTTVIR